MNRNARRCSPGPRRIAAFLLGIGLSAGLAPSLLAQDNQENAGEQALESLQAAYQREFVFLDSEIRLLTDRLEEATASGEQRVRQSRARLDALEEELLELRRSVDRRQEELDVLLDEAAATRNTDDVVQQVVEQANGRLEEFNVAPFESSVEGAERLAAELDYVIDQSFSVLDSSSRITRSPGEFFLEDGAQVSGRIVSVGRIAAFGVSEQGSGTLAPAGDGMLRLIDRDTAPVARSLLSEDGESEEPTLPLFVFESRDSLVEVDEGGSFAETLEAAGVIGYVIVGIGILALLLGAARLLLLARASRGAKGGGAQRVTELVREGKEEAARAEAERIPGALGRVLSATVDGLRYNPQEVEDIISESVLNEQPALDRFRTALGVFAAVAPLLGLLGTVTGMITTFDVITQFGTGDPTLLSGGISEALITTEFGLIVAIPTLLLGNLLSSWSDRITSNMEVSALRLVNVSSGAQTAAARDAG